MNALEAMARAIEESMDHGMWTYKGAVRAALLALRDCEVTEAMQDAWHYSGMNYMEPAEHVTATTEFRAMLDAILEQQP